MGRRGIFFSTLGFVSVLFLSAPVKQKSKESRKSILTKAYVIQLGELDSKQTGYEIKKSYTFASCVYDVQY